MAITKYDASGSFLQYSTYIGGASSTEIVSSLIVNAQNELMLYGATGSIDFPITPGAYDSTFGGGSALSFVNNGTIYDNGTDLYVTKFNATGTALIGSTYVGGTENDGVNASAILSYNYGDYYRGEIQVDNAGNCYVASCTYSTDFPTAAGCLQPVAGGSMDGVVFKLNSSFTALTWSTYLGGSADDGCYALAVDNTGSVFTTGGTASNNFPTTAGVISTTYNGGSTDGFITKISNDGTAILKSTFIGTSSYDQSFLIQLDRFSDVYIVGQSEGSMPVSAGVYSNPNSKQFIWKVDNNLSTKKMTTIFGNGNGLVNLSPSAFLVDNCENIYFCGWGGNILTNVKTLGLPVSANAYQSSTEGFNFYLFVLTPDAASLLYATYFGGASSAEHVDGGTSRFDKKGIVYQAVCAGCNGYDDFPVTPGSWPRPLYGNNVNQSTNCNMGVFKFDFQAAGVNADAVISPNDTLCIGGVVNFNNTSNNAFSYIWDFGDGSPVSTAISPVHMYGLAGTFDVTLIAVDPNGCVYSDTTHLEIVVVPPPMVKLGNDTIVCQQPNLVLDAGTSGYIYTWSTGAATRTITVTAPGTYWVSVSNGKCAVRDTINIEQFNPPAWAVDSILCDGQMLTLNAAMTGATYKWSTGDVSSSIDVTSAGGYWVTITKGLCKSTDTSNINFIFYPTLNITPSGYICPDDSIILDANGPAETYKWSSGQTTQAITASIGGTYTVTATNKKCAVTATTTVTMVNPVNWDESITLCNLEKYLLDAGTAGGFYLWSTGDTTQKISITQEGEYWVRKNVDGCVSADTIVVKGDLGSGILWFPNTFTPDANLLNDVFAPKGQDITYYHLMIFDRWGELIFETKNLNEGWNGIYKGRLSQQDVYVWKAQYKSKCSGDLLHSKIGSVTVLR